MSDKTIKGMIKEEISNIIQSEASGKSDEHEMVVRGWLRGTFPVPSQGLKKIGRYVYYHLGEEGFNQLRKIEGWTQNILRMKKSIRDSVVDDAGHVREKIKSDKIVLNKMIKDLFSQLKK